MEQSTEALVARIVSGVPSVTQRVVVSRAMDPTLSNQLRKSLDVVEAPTVWGRTVWDAAPGHSVVEDPNWWGGRERSEPSHVVGWIDRRYETLTDGDPGTPDPSGWTERLRAARRCAKALNQLRGVTVAYGAPQAPWFVVLQPEPAARVADAMCGDGLITSPIGRNRPELPGGIRIEAPAEPGSAWVAACVASLRRALGAKRPAG